MECTLTGSNEIIFEIEETVREWFEDMSHEAFTRTDNVLSRHFCALVDNPVHAITSLVLNNINWNMVMSIIHEDTICEDTDQENDPELNL